MPALRTRGVNLAIVTLGIGVIVDEVVLANTNYTGGFSGTPVRPPTLFGLSLNAEISPSRYFLLCLGFLVVCSLAVSNLRRSSVGRYLIAVRGNERAAASLGLNVARLKLYAFAVSAVLGGTINPFQLQILDIRPIDLSQRAVAMTRITSRICEPILRFPISMQQAVVGHLRLQRTDQQPEPYQQLQFHVPFLFLFFACYLYTA